MSPTLLHTDEEVDTSVYGAYLRAQSDPDLLDIAQHLDLVRYPARCDAAAREVRRRGLLHAPVYSAAESVFRRLALAAMALALVTLALTCLLTPEDAAGPSWPTGEMLPDGIPLTTVIHLFSIAILRGLVVWSARLGMYPLLALLLGGWTVQQMRPLFLHRARADVWRLAGFGGMALLLAVLLAVGPRSAVPDVFHVPADATLWQRALPFCNPFVPRETSP